MKNSLKFKLFITISLLVSLTLLVVGGIGFVVAKHEIHEAFDADMAESAKLILRIARHNPSQNFLAKDEEEIQEKIFHKFEKEIHLQVWKKNKLIHDSDKGFVVELPLEEGYKDLMIRDEKWRQFSLYDQKSELTISILERYKIRWELVFNILASLFIPLFFTFPAILLVIYGSIKNRLQPLSELSKEIEKLSANTLTTFKNDNSPLEVMPLVNSLNTMIMRLEEAMEAERRFTNYAAHELRTPIAAIKLQLQLLLKNKDHGKQEEYLKDLISGVDRMTHLVDQILVLSRLEPENRDFDKEEINLGFLAKKIIEQNSAIIAEKKLQINYDFTQEAIIQGNKIYIEIMMSNLIDNAIKYSVNDGLIKLVLEKRKEGIILAISNCGKKFSSEEITKLFEKFYRSNVDVIGCGLGLAIVKKIVKLHEADIKFTSEEKGNKAVNIVEVRFLNNLIFINNLIN